MVVRGAAAACFVMFSRNEAVAARPQRRTRRLSRNRGRRQVARFGQFAPGLAGFFCRADDLVLLALTGRFALAGLMLSGLPT